MSQSTAVQPTQPARGLLRSWSDLDGLAPGEYVECHNCRAEYDRADVARLQGSERDDVLCECGMSGFIVRGRGHAETIKDRRPMLSGTFWALPVELRTYGHLLGLTLADIAVIGAIDDAPRLGREWDDSRRQIAERAGCGCTEAAVKRTLSKLLNYTDPDGNARPLIEAKRVYYREGCSGMVRDLTPLWLVLAELVAAGAEPDQTGSNPTQSDRPKIDPIPSDTPFRQSRSSEAEPPWNAQSALPGLDIDDAGDGDAEPIDDADTLLACYQASAVGAMDWVGGKSPDPPALTARDKRLAAQLLADGRHWDNDLDELFEWASMEPFWRPKVLESFTKFGKARSLAEIERQAGQRPLRECRCWDSFVPTRAQQRIIEKWGDEAVACPACQAKYEVAA